MSWNAYLIDDRGHYEGEWNYTHNCNGMANAVLDPTYEQRPVAEEVFRFKDREHVSWWHRLDGLSGPEGAALLDQILRGLRADPKRFEAMSPSNGWGDYDGFVKVLTSMRDAVPEWPTTWRVNG
jgi:hypothetical protein